MDEAKISLLARIARSSSAGSQGGNAADLERPGSILSLAAACYGAQPEDHATVPTGFDPQAVALFDAIVEGAYLVATADGTFDDEERRTFERVVTAACSGAVAPSRISALVSDLRDRLAADGSAVRIEKIAKRVFRPDHAREVIRVGALLALASGDVGDEERRVLDRLASALGLDGAAVDAAVAEVRGALASADAR